MFSIVSVSPCPGCGIEISARAEIPFLVKKKWREMVAKELGYSSSFIVGFGAKTRIHKHHFHAADIKNGKPTGKFKKSYLFIKYMLYVILFWAFPH